MSEFKLHDSTGHWIARVFSAMRREFDKALKEHNVTIGEWAVLASVYHGEATTPSEIADYADVDRAVVTRMLDKLTDEKRHTSRQLSDRDRRSFTVKLTSSGTRLTRKLLAENQRINDEFLAGLSRTEAAELRRLLRSMLFNATSRANSPSKSKLRTGTGRSRVDQKSSQVTKR